MKKNICVLVAALHLASCTVLTPLPHTRGDFAPSSIREGDKLVLTTTSGFEKKLEVVSITPGQVCGKDGCVSADEVGGVGRQEFSAVRTFGLIVAIGLIVAAAAAGAGGAAFGFPAGY